MDIFRFNFDTDPTVLEQGEIINGLTSKMWIERYNEPGEFEFTSPLSKNLRAVLPLGTFISHSDTLEVMIVENHEIEDDGESDPILKTTGRSFVSYLENRIVGVDVARVISSVTEVSVGADSVPVQITNLINTTIHPSDVADADDALGNIIAVYEADVGTNATRTHKPGVLWERVKELLKIDDLGIRTIRRNVFGTLGSDDETVIETYTGVDRSDTIIFSWRAGDLEQAQYLFTLKNLKNAALVMGRYIWRVVDGAEAGYDRRFMLVDASDIDGTYTTVPTGGTLTAVLAKMLTRGQEALRSQTTIALVQGDIPNIRSYRYRLDFNVGDIIRLSGNFGEIANMRITEFTEIEDENGESSHPTLSLPGV